MAVDRYNPVTGAPEFLAGGPPDMGADETLVAAFAAEVGTRRIGTTAERQAVKFRRPGMLFFDTSEWQEYIFRDGAWKAVRPSETKRYSSATNAQGVVVTTHSLGKLPSGAQVTIAHGSSETVTLLASAVIWELTDSAAQVRFRRADQPNTWFAGQPVSFYITFFA
ncbi:hypothetical protein [Mycetocola spongiae]|uniref:hypothetical protein n=1 Tax=Mycetocola spongiae TaxID=2859226 RepID=UPI001CF51E71|nr:hypothetical protein [Mycetocola spongiae]UCR89240.1 hypothetical protein KXZ72_00560 [Mycetocola spongiae]